MRERDSRQRAAHARELMNEAQKLVGDRPIIRVVFTLADGTELRRDYTWGDQQAGRMSTWADDGPPAWLDEPLKSWPNPQEPIMLAGRVQEGFEYDAATLLLQVDLPPAVSVQGDNDGQ